jgi:hypothetical protein
VANELFPSFCHNTTTYVGIPHDAPSILFVYNDQEPCYASIQVDGREVHSVRLEGRQTHIELHKLRAPAVTAVSDSLLEAFTSIFRVRRRANCKSQTRLYAFSVVLQADTPQRNVLATYQFHVLCPREFQDALAVHHEICHSPEAIAPDSISHRAEGRCCPHCIATRERLEDKS